MLYEYELAGCLTEQHYEANIPDECSMTTMQDHLNMMLCWGLQSALERGQKMDCSGCDENKINNNARMIKFKLLKESK